MSKPSNVSGPDDEHGLDEERKRIAEVDKELDAQADGEGLAAEAGRGETTGITEG